MSFGFGFALPAYPLRGGGGNNPFNQLGPTLDLSFTGVVTDLTDPNGYTLNTDFIIPQYQIAAQYLIWETGVGLVDKTFSQIITFTRASTGTFFDSAGVLQSAANDTPRFDYNPATLAARGLLIEEARTNSIRNNTMQGAAAGTPGTLPTNWSVSGFSGLTREIVGVGVFNGVTYVDIKYSGTSSGAFGDIYFDGTTVIAATNAQSWSGSAWVQVVAGTQNGVSSINLGLLQYDSGGVALGAATLGSPSATISTTWQRINRVGTTNNASIAFVRHQIAIGITSGVAIDITLRIGLPQLELGAFATSVIPTTTTALTRSADVASVNTLSPWYNASEGTLFADWTSFIPNGTSPGSTYAAGFTDNIATSGAAQLTIQNRAVVNQIRVWQSTTGGGLDDFITPTNTTFQGKAAATYGGGSNVNASANGGAVVTMTNLIQTTAFNALLLGLFTTAATGSGSNYLNGYLRRIVYYPRRLSNAELQSITS